jgi:hypothetical protein
VRAFGFISALLVAAIGMGVYMHFMKQASPGPGMVATQAISLTGVQSDLMSIAQAERMYYAQNGSYADMSTLQSNGTMNIARTGRDGYSYSIDTSPTGFIATARYIAAPTDVPAGIAPPHFPTVSIDQSMEIHQQE